MEDFLALQQKIAPEIIELVERRYTILRTIAQYQPVGRRALAQKLGLGERTVRGDVEILRTQGCISTDQTGVNLTEVGEMVISQLGSLMRSFWGMQELEYQVQRLLGIKEVIVVPGNADADDAVKDDMGRMAAHYLRDHLVHHRVIAITGGTTTLAVADAMPQTSPHRDLIIVPARGGLGEELEIQANHIAAKLARKLGGQYRMLHVPDYLSKDAVQTLLSEPQIDDVVEIIKQASVVVHGIGCAEKMAQRRGCSPEEQKIILEQRAEGEALGYYFDRAGKVVMQANSIGLKLAQLNQVKVVIAVAGGSSKAKAIQAVVRSRHQLTLVTDEAAAKEMLQSN